MVKNKSLKQVLPDIDSAFYKISLDNKSSITLPSNDVFYEPFLSPKKLNPFARSFKPVMNMNNVNNINKENMPINKCRVSTPLIIKKPSSLSRSQSPSSIITRPMITIYRSPKVVTEQVFVIKPLKTLTQTTPRKRSSSPKSTKNKK